MPNPPYAASAASEIDEARERLRERAETRVNRSAYRTGVVPAAQVVRALVLVLRIIAVLLVLLSVLGTFYSLRGQAFSLTDPWAALYTAPDSNRALLGITGTQMLLAVGIQALLSLGQWGGRALAHTQSDPRWYLLYAGALALSAALNWSAYATPMLDGGMPLVLVAAIIVGGDLAPEFILMK